MKRCASTWLMGHWRDGCEIFPVPQYGSTNTRHQQSTDDTGLTLNVMSDPEVRQWSLRTSVGKTTQFLHRKAVSMRGGVTHAGKSNLKWPPDSCRFLLGPSSTSTSIMILLLLVEVVLWLWSLELSKRNVLQCLLVFDHSSTDLI